jgi:hypothetical protein
MRPSLTVVEKERLESIKLFGLDRMVIKDAFDWFRDQVSPRHIMLPVLDTFEGLMEGIDLLVPETDVCTVSTDCAVLAFLLGLLSDYRNLADLSRVDEQCVDTLIDRFDPPESPGCLLLLKVG